MGVFKIDNQFSLVLGNDPALGLQPFITATRLTALTQNEQVEWRLRDADGALTYQDGAAITGDYESLTIKIHNVTGRTPLLTAGGLTLDAAAIGQSLADGDTTNAFALLFAGNDFIIGSNASDVLFGGAGDDVFFPQSNPAVGFTSAVEDIIPPPPDLIDGGDGIDTVRLDLSGEAYADFGVIVAVNGNTVTVRPGNSDAFETYRMVNIEQLRLIGSVNDNVITGLDGNDIINLSGSSGGNGVVGGGGDDFVIGGSGRDSLRGGDGADRLRGGDGRDVLLGQNGDDNLRGGAGNDTVFGGDGADFVFGGDGDDNLQGNIGDDVIHGGADNDSASGGGGRDKIFGGLGDDLLIGNTGDDRLHGGLGDDRLLGGSGADVLIGGQGADVFVFTPESLITPGGIVDRILDFTPGIDRIDLTDMALASTDPLTLVRSALSGSAVIEFGDGHGIYLQGVAPDDLSAADFIT